MKALSFFRVVAELAVSTGVGAIVSNASRSAVPQNAHIIKKVTVGIGTFILSNMVADQAVKYTNEKIEFGLDEIKKAKETWKESQEQQKSEEEPPLTGTIQDS